MNIVTKQQHEDYWIADCVDIAGMPPIGTGQTEAMAVAVLILRLTNDLNIWYRLVSSGLTSDLKINNISYRKGL